MPLKESLQKDRTFPKRVRSHECYRQLCELFPAGVNSPVRAMRSLTDCPLIVERGEGAELVDIDGKRYTDYCMSWGTLIHGHAHPKINKSIAEALADGTTFGATTLREGKLARLITEHVPSVEQLRFTSSGTEATMAALRLARGVTGRPLCAKFDGNYHGSTDCLLVKAGSGVANFCPDASSAGVPQELVGATLSLPYNDLDGCAKIILQPQVASRLAAIIVEPISGNMGCVPPQDGFLHGLKELCHSVGALLIIDEVITGFRVGLGGAQKLYDIQADITCFGKIMCGGVPAAAFGGRKELMGHLAPLGPVYQGGTLSGNPLSMAAGYTALSMLSEAVFADLQEKTDAFLAPIEDLIAKKNLNACVQRVGSMFCLYFGVKKVTTNADLKNLDHNVFKTCFNYLFERGHYLAPWHNEANFISTVHTKEQLQETQKVILEFLVTV